MAKVINWLDKESLKNAYILDGVNPMIAKLRAKFDCFNNPYSKKYQKIINDEIRDAYIIDGSKESIINKLKSKLTNKKSLRYHGSLLSGFVDVIGTGLFAIILVLLVVGAVILIRTALFAFIFNLLWNCFVVSAFNVNEVTFNQSMVVGLVLALFLPGGSSKKEKS